jgi:hypothetical protein
MSRWFSLHALRSRQLFNSTPIGNYVFLAAIGLYGILAYLGFPSHARDRHPYGSGVRPRAVVWLVCGKHCSW